MNASDINEVQDICLKPVIKIEETKIENNFLYKCNCKKGDCRKSNCTCFKNNVLCNLSCHGQSHSNCQNFV